MSFVAENIIKTANLPPAAGSNTNGSLWHYKAGSDTALVVSGASYFNAWRKYLQPGDIIHAEVENNKFAVYRVATVPLTANVTVTHLALASPA